MTRICFLILLLITLLPYHFAQTHDDLPVEEPDVQYTPMEPSTFWIEDNFLSDTEFTILRTLIDTYSSPLFPPSPRVQQPAEKYGTSWGELQVRKEIGSEERDVIIGVRERVMDLIQRKHYPEGGIYHAQTLLYKRLQGGGSIPHADATDYDCTTHTYKPVNASQSARCVRAILLLSDGSEGGEVNGGALHLHANYSTHRYSENDCYFPVEQHINSARGRLVVFSGHRVHSMGTVVGGSRYGMSLYFTCQQRFSPIYEGGIQPDIPWQKRHLEYLSHTLGAREIPQHLTDRIDALHPDALPKPKKFVGVVAEERRVRKEEKKRKKGKQVKKIRETTAFVFEGDKPF